MKMKLPISTLEWMLGINLIYLVVGLLDIHYQWWPTEYVQAVWVTILSMPIWLPLQKFIDMDPIWKLKK